MTLVEYKIVGGLIIFLTSLIALIYPVKARSYPKHHPLLELADAFASGIFLGVALFHLLPDSIRLFAELYGNIHYPVPEILCASGFLLLLFLERVAGLCSKTLSANSLPYMLTFILIIHALIEGATLGINTAFATASILFLAIIVHKGSECFALAVILNRSQIAYWKIIWIIILFSLMTPLGIFFGTTLTDVLQASTGQLITACFDAFAAGTFLYMSTLHHINHHERQHESEGLLEFVFLLLGLVLMAAFAGLA